MEGEGGEGNSFAVISGGEVSFVEDPETTMRVSCEDGLFVFVSGEGEELCRGKLIETTDGASLELEGGDGTETWRKITDAPKVVSRKKGALPRIFTKEGQQGSNKPEVEE